MEDATAPKLKAGAVEFEPAPNWKGCAGAGAAEGAAGGAVWLSCCCCPNTKAFAAPSSEEELWPNTKVLDGAGVGAREEVVGVLKRLGVELDEAGALEELAMKPKVGVGADVSGKHTVGESNCGTTRTWDRAPYFCRPKPGNALLVQSSSQSQWFFFFG